MLWILISLFVASGALMVGLGIPLMRRRVRPNGLYGLRVAATLSNEKVWYEANAASGRDLVWLGIALILAALILPLFFKPEVYALIWAALSGVGTLGMCVRGVRRANELHRELKE